MSENNLVGSHFARFPPAPTPVAAPIDVALNKQTSFNRSNLKI